MERTIALFEYRNGRFGTNTASIKRVPGGYTVCNGYYDPMFWKSPVEAKASFRRVVAIHSNL